ncbi:DUF5018 domain-containing protein [Maribacter dokdonensis]|uniref:DUF5018 domain-containing protein n=1 Tax=Maribacter dokdonensis TaxID=320912 RepID=UPI001C08F182|nr:DUF5018 domain-containing protein [Maribacter dokdonensis]MBU2899933.1 DUF5018 domain-containing protein [Maribacter dokdonensis]
MKHAKYIVWFVLIVVACSKNDDKPEPENKVDPIAVQLEFPLKNSECTAGVDQSNDKTLVEFRWAVTENDSYELVLENLYTNQVTRTSTSNHSVEIVLDKNTPYEWHIISSLVASQEKVESERWKFYAAGEGVSNYAPFPADLLSPDEDLIFDTGTQQLKLEWQSSDIDDVSVTYDVLVGNENPPTEVVASDLTQSSFDISVSAGNAMFWRIATKDGNGNISYSKVRGFTIGRVSSISSFTINQDGEDYAAEIDAAQKVIRIQLGNFDYKKLSPEISLKEGYSINPKSGEVLNFHDTLFYTITDPHGNETVYDVIVDSGQHEVLSFRVINGNETYIGEVDSESATIFIQMGNFDYGDVNPEIEISNEASVELIQVSGMDLKSPATFTVTSEIGTTKEFTVMADIGMYRLNSYFRNPGFEFSDAGEFPDYKVFAGSTQTIYAFNIQDHGEVSLELVDEAGVTFDLPFSREQYDHYHSFETSSSSNYLTSVIPDSLPGGIYRLKISEGLRSKIYPQRFEVINDARVIRITEINKTDFSRGDTLIMKGVNLKRKFAVASNGNIYLFDERSRDLSINADGTEMQLIFSTNTYGNLKSWTGNDEKPLAIQTEIDEYPHSLNSNIIYFNVN